MHNNRNVAIVQPIVPHYRVDFFDNLNKLGNYKVFASTVDFTGLRGSTLAESRDYFNELDSFVKIPFLSAYWQRGVLCRHILFSDVVVISGNPRVLNHMILFIFRKLFHKPVAWWGQGWTANRRGMLAKIRRYLMLHSDAIILYTSKEASEIKYHKNVIGLDNGIDIKPINNSLDKIKESKKRNLKLLKLVFIGRLTEKANLMWLLKTLKYVRREVELTIIGSGPLEKDIKSFVSGMDDNISFIFTGEIFESDEIAKHLCSADAFVYPGSVGLSLIHAFAHGLPALLVGGDEDHMPEYSAFKDGYNGFTLPSDTREAGQFFEQLSISSLYQMRSKAKNTVANRFNTDVMAERFDFLIKGI
ncbi:glycosyltransferase family 4 protein [Vibrio fluvialis]|nr:glycosyltransferase family 4 protein [Vibrio fluvialis]